MCLFFWACTRTQCACLHFLSLSRILANFFSSTAVSHVFLLLLQLVDGYSTHRSSGQPQQQHERGLDCLLLRAHLVPVSCSRRKDSAEKSGRTTTECCWRASVSCLLRFTSPWVHRDPAIGSLGLRSSCSDQPIITTGFMSIRWRKESPKASLCTISLLSNTELSTWGRQTCEQNTF